MQHTNLFALTRWQWLIYIYNGTHTVGIGTFLLGTSPFGVGTLALWLLHWLQ